MHETKRKILVIGGGIAGITAAVEAAEVGVEVILVEKEPYLGGRVMRTYRYFPKMCPPTCGFEINVRRIRQNPRIEVHTMATVHDITGRAGAFKARIRKNPRYVTGTHSFDESVAGQIESERSDDFNLGLSRTKALYLPHDMAYPDDYVLDRAALSEADAHKLEEICPPGSIDLGMQVEEFEIEVASIILATGWRPYDATKISNLGFGKFENVVTNVMVERFAARGGPTGGQILRPSDKKVPTRVAFVQCAGSRDENHLPYCSAVCCMGSLKQARYVREKCDGAEVTVFYIDIRAVGRLEKFYFDLLEDEHVHFVKGKVARITEVPESLDLVLDVEDTVTGEALRETFDLVVLATGIVPNTDEIELPAGIQPDAYGFLDGTVKDEGIFAAGCAKRPCDVSRTTRESTAAALKAIQVANGGR